MYVLLLGWPMCDLFCFGSENEMCSNLVVCLLAHFWGKKSQSCACGYAPETHSLRLLKKIYIFQIFFPDYFCEYIAWECFFCGDAVFCNGLLRDLWNRQKLRDSFFEMRKTIVGEKEQSIWVGIWVGNPTKILNLLIIYYPTLRIVGDFFCLGWKLREEKKKIRRAILPSLP